MYCTNCGTEVPEKAKFCPSCGTPVALVEEKHAENKEKETVSGNMTFQVTLQGISQDMMGANGSYDPVELGVMNTEQFSALWKKLSEIQPMKATAPNQDICPASMTINYRDEIYAFELLGGSILYSNSNTVVSENDALLLISGEKPAAVSQKKSKDAKGNAHENAQIWGSDHKDVKGLTPVRKTGIPPTDRVKTESAIINAGNSPQISDNVIKSSTSKNVFIAPLLFGILAIVLALGGFAVAEPGLGAVSLIVAIVLFIVSGSLKGKSRAILRIGFDWNYNAIWVIFPGKKLTYIGNANCITKFSIEKTQLSSTRYTNIGSSEVRINTAVQDKHNIWMLMVEKTDGSRIPLITLYNEQDAFRVMNKVTYLLNQQV
ncbi:MAG: hypothetical protein CVU05_05925 [Bacteroidetes bacterium HGW-Bacteroidetes-21]|jgi:uncharacterized Zn finger protein (UPF0148 family)|nr:MAG: hypothetical protein CVU05_05925 [Bacteroidetes bacterium HGW-Bacteroidetes-21]